MTTTRYWGVIVGASLFLPLSAHGTAQTGQTVPTTPPAQTAPPTTGQTTTTPPTGAPTEQTPAVPAKPAPPPPVPAFEEVWRQTIDSPGAPRLAATSAYVILAQSESGISCRAAQDGHEVWRAALPTKLAPVIGGTLVFVVSNGGLHALDLATGSSRWVQEEVGEPAGLSWHENRLVAVTGQEIRAWLPDGRTAWRMDLGAQIVPPTAVDGDTIFAALADQRIVALDGASGATRWTLPLETTPHALVAKAGRLFFAGADDAIYA